MRQGIAGLLAAEPDMALVAEAANGREAIQQFRAHRPDVTLMDLQMPEMGGLPLSTAAMTMRALRPYGLALLAIAVAVGLALAALTSHWAASTYRSSSSRSAS